MKNIVILSMIIQIFAASSCTDDKTTVNRDILSEKGKGKYWDVVFVKYISSDGKIESYSLDVAKLEPQTIDVVNNKIEDGQLSIFYNSSIYFDREKKINFENIYFQNEMTFLDYKKNRLQAVHGKVLPKSSYGFLESNIYEIKGDSLITDTFGKCRIEYADEDAIILSGSEESGVFQKIILSSSPVQEKKIIKDTSELKKIFPNKKWWFQNVNFGPIKTIEI